MASKKAKKIIITGIATVVGIFGGMKLYSNKKDKAEPKVIKFSQEEKTEA